MDILHALFTTLYSLLNKDKTEKPARAFVVLVAAVVRDLFFMGRGEEKRESDNKV